MIVRQIYDCGEALVIKLSATQWKYEKISVFEEYDRQIDHLAIRPIGEKDSYKCHQK